MKKIFIIMAILLIFISCSSVFADDDVSFNSTELDNNIIVDSE